MKFSKWLGQMAEYFLSEDAPLIVHYKPQPVFALREVFADDHEFLLSLHNDPIVLHNLTNPTPITMEQHLIWWEKTKNNCKERRFIFTVNGQPAGFTKFYSMDAANLNCVLGADLHKDFRGKGYAKFMWNLMLEYCFYTLGMYRVSLTTAKYNLIGQKVYKNLGFIEEGRFKESLFRDGKFYDQILMYKLSNK
jgi:RimJ/RimL family protein N-acetyltransferase